MGVKPRRVAFNARRLANGSDTRAQYTYRREPRSRIRKKPRRASPAYSDLLFRGCRAQIP